MTPDWLPILIFPAFVALWVTVCFLLARTGGWRALAEVYAGRAGEFTGRRWYLQSGAMRGFARYDGALIFGADPGGLHLAVLFLFRAGHPPLYIPWDDIRLHERRGWLFPSVDLTFTRVPGVHLTLARSVAEQLARAAGRAV